MSKLKEIEKLFKEELPLLKKKIDEVNKSVEVLLKAAPDVLDLVSHMEEAQKQLNMIQLQNISLQDQLRKDKETKAYTAPPTEFLDESEVLKNLQLEKEQLDEMIANGKIPVASSSQGKRVFSRKKVTEIREKIMGAMTLAVPKDSTERLKKMYFEQQRKENK